jgi:hypothetical protein
VRALIKSVIEQRMSSGELDDTDLTLRDLEKIQDSFTATLRGIYHPRIEYPRLEKKAQLEVDTLPRGLLSGSEPRSMSEATRPIAEPRKAKGEVSKESPEAADAGPERIQPATQESGR